MAQTPKPYLSFISRCGHMSLARSLKYSIGLRWGLVRSVASLPVVSLPVPRRSAPPAPGDQVNLRTFLIYSPVSYGL